MSRRLYFPLLFVAMLLVSFVVGCARPPLVLHPLNQEVAVSEALENFAYPEDPCAITVEFSEKRKTYDILRITYPAFFQGDPNNDEVIAWYYRQHGGQTLPGILQIPILGGDYGPSIAFAEYYAGKGFHVLRFERKDDLFAPEKGLEHTRQVMINSVIDMRRGIDWWETLPEVDNRRLGASGISMGGFFGSVLAAVDERIAAAVLMLNGGDLAQLLTITDEGWVEQMRKEFLARNQWTHQQLYEEAHRLWRDIDPLTVAPKIDPNKVLLISARFDRIVPYSLSTAWWEAAHRPQRITLPCSHYSSVVFISYIQKKCANHFRRVFMARKTDDQHRGGSALRAHHKKKAASKGGLGIAKAIEDY